MQRFFYNIVLVIALTSSTCFAASEKSTQPGVGPNLTLPEPEKNLIPTVNVAPARGWPANTTPVSSVDNTTVKAFASGLDHPRWLYVLPNGDVLVAETNSPPKPEDSKGVKGWVMGKTMKRAGAVTPSANRITLLRDSDGDGIADVKTVFIDGLNSPFGMTLIGSELYVANSDAIVHFPYRTGETRITDKVKVLTHLPAGELNHHWTKNIIASADGTKIYATVGSNSNVAENGISVESERAAIWVVDVKNGSYKIFASGLRNPNGMAWEPETSMLWTVVNERDELGNDLVPDYLTSVREDGFYGWPYSYFGAHVDERVKPQRPDLVAKAIVPDYGLGAHTASLGLTSAAGNSLSSALANGMFIGQHGSWNRKPFSGYKVIFVPFQNGKPSGVPIDVLTGFINDKDEAYGRPVGVAIDKRGGLLVADDVGNIVWRVAHK